MVDKAKLNALADYIERRTDMEFSMCWHSTCIMRFAHEQSNEVRPTISSEVMRSFGLDTDQIHLLCFGSISGLSVVGLERVTRAEAVATIRHLAETGEVDWDAYWKENNDAQA